MLEFIGGLSQLTNFTFKLFYFLKVKLIALAVLAFLVLLFLKLLLELSYFLLEVLVFFQNIFDVGFLNI